MKRSITALSLLTAIALLGLSNLAGAEELWVIKDGVLNKEGPFVVPGDAVESPLAESN
jgi:hypothetical protein